jgi:hypothetical protein
MRVRNQFSQHGAHIGNVLPSVAIAVEADVVDVASNVGK